MISKVTNIGELATFNPETGEVDRPVGADIICEDGIITAIGSDLPSADIEIDATGALVRPVS